VNLILFLAVIGLLSDQRSMAAAPPRVWTVQKTTDPMDDRQSVVMIAKGAVPHTSLRVHCNDNGEYVAFITLPKTLVVPNPNVIELRFDKEASTAYVLQSISIASLVSAIGGSTTDANYGIASVTAPGSSPSAPLEQAGKAIVAALRKASRAAYRLSLATPAPGTEGVFDVRGFDRVERSVGWRCAGRADLP
jgi:hypothetical protein